MTEGTCAAHPGRPIRLVTATANTQETQTNEQGCVYRLLLVLLHDNVKN